MLCSLSFCSATPSSHSAFEVRHLHLTLLLFLKASLTPCATAGNYPAPLLLLGRLRQLPPSLPASVVLPLLLLVVVVALQVLMLLLVRQGVQGR